MLQATLPVIMCLVLGAPADSTTPAVTERVEVQRDDERAPRQPSLQFLRDNRVFLRSQLDRLRLLVTRERAGDATLLDERFLRLQEMSAAIAAAQDTIGAEGALAARRSLMTSVSELARLEASLDMMDSLLVDQRRRLLWLEQDFLGRQETALVIVIRGVPSRHVPASVVVTEGADVTRIALTPQQCSSLAQGGIAQIYHEFTEPRLHAIGVSLEGGAWSGSQPLPVTFEAPRDQLTFLELDLGGLDPARPGDGLVARVWHRQVASR